MNVLNALAVEIVKLQASIERQESELDECLANEDENITDEQLEAVYGGTFERIKRTKFVLAKKQKLYEQAKVDYQAAHYREMAQNEALTQTTTEKTKDISKMTGGQTRRWRFEDTEDFRRAWNKEQILTFL